jgi:hypothetical protein
MPAERSEKKRKRESGKQERPSKTHALEQDMPALTVRLLEDDSELAPVLRMNCSLFLISIAYLMLLRQAPRHLAAHIHDFLR